MNAHEIVPGVWIGDFEAGVIWQRQSRATLCVLEGRREDLPSRTMWVPILHGTPPMALIAQLWTAAHVIQRHREQGIPLLVHCGAGHERAPLVVAWWLAHFEKQPMSLADAYAVIERVRKVRRAWDWLPAEVAR